MKKLDRYVKIVRRNDNNGGHRYSTILFSESRTRLPSGTSHMQFKLDYEGNSRPNAELFAYKLATCLECRVVQ